MVNLFPDPVGNFGLSGRLGVAGGAALQAVSECPRRRQAGILQNFVMLKILNCWSFKTVESSKQYT